MRGTKGKGKKKRFNLWFDTQEGVCTRGHVCVLRVCERERVSRKCVCERERETDRQRERERESERKMPLLFLGGACECRRNRCESETDCVPLV